MESNYFWLPIICSFITALTALCCNLFANGARIREINLQNKIEAERKQKELFRTKLECAYKFLGVMSNSIIRKQLVYKELLVESEIFWESYLRLIVEEQKTFDYDEFYSVLELYFPKINLKHESLLPTYKSITDIEGDIQSIKIKGSKIEPETIAKLTMYYSNVLQVIKDVQDDLKGLLPLYVI